MINVGIIGFGMSGKVFHSPLINSVEGFKILKIRETDNDRISEINKHYPWVDIVSDVKNLYNDDKLDLIVVATPNVVHFDLAKQALEANKHVIVEKPFTVASKEADELIELANERDKILTVFQNRRFDSDFLTVKNIIDGGMLGNLVEYEAHFDRFRNYIKDKWKERDIPGAGILYDLGAHLIDQALVLFGEPIEIFADIRRQRPNSKTDDNFEIILSYKNLKVSLKAGMLVKEEEPHFVLKGTQGSFVKYGMDPQEDLLSNGYTPLNTENWGAEKKENWGILNTSYKNTDFRGNIKSIPGDYSLFYKNVRDTILGKEELLVKPSQARDVIKIIELAQKSNFSKKVLPYK
ncbi:MAG: oxidoreductase [Fusobacteriota bacterium]